jgi:hypothetical protein
MNSIVPTQGGKMRLRTLFLVGCTLLFVATFQGQSNSGVNNAELHGIYAFDFSGVSGNSSVSSVYAAVGRFTADGAGNLTNGELDTNGVGGNASTAQAFTGTYAIGADHRGVMTLIVGGSTASLAFAMMADGHAAFIKFDAAGGSGTVGAGTIEPADATAYSTSRIVGDYAISVAGQDNVNNRAAIVGRFTSNGAGTLANLAGDLNGYGTPYSMSFTSATYTVSDATHGRGTMNLTFTFGGSAASLNFVFYVVNAGKLFVMERDMVTPSTPLLSGALLQQQLPAGGFSNASLNGNMVMYLTGMSACNNGSGVPKAVAGLLTAAGNGTLSLTYDENYCRAPGGITGFAGTYAVAGNGRTAIALGGYRLVAYLLNSNEAFLLDSDANVLSGLLEPQASGTLTSAALQGAYAGSATNPVDFAVNVFSGEFSANGSTLTGTVDEGLSSGPVSGATFNASYSVSASPTNGRGMMTITSGSGGAAAIYMISSSKFVVVPLQDPNPSVWVFEQSSGGVPPPPPTATLSSLTLSPTTVVGGTQSSTGTVTLTAPAPAGGAQVALSSSNTNVARVPASVTVAAGATTATFAISTSAVSTSATVSISASYGSAARSASLTVTPPPPTLTSLTLNPTSVFGGFQSSTGTVTLSSPALAGGAQVALSSNNSAAQVPSSVTVPAGATSASFTVSTSAVLFSTSATITASYNNTARSATLSIY